VGSSKRSGTRRPRSAKPLRQPSLSSERRMSSPSSLPSATRISMCGSLLRWRWASSEINAPSNR
jgi:hypothetical protein